MSLGGTDLYDLLDPTTVPDLVKRAVTAARALDFGLCVHPATGRLLQSLAGGMAPGAIVAETGTGTGAGLAWMVSFADPQVQFLSVELDEPRAQAAQDVFADHPNVTVIQGDAGLLFARGPFDLMVFDGGWGPGKNPGSPVVELEQVVKPGGMCTIDDFAPMTTYPPTFKGTIDAGRHSWLTRADVLATEVQVAPNMSVLLAKRVSGLPDGR